MAIVVKNHLPLVVIAGPTASGKTGLAIKLAKKYGGEIICADSRTIYKGMNIGTAKPTRKEMSGVPHWGLDLVNPGEYFSASDFKDYSLKKIDEIRSRGHIPFLVGGTGLYIDGIIFNYKFGVQANDELRQNLQEKSVQELQAYCLKNNIKLPENNKNKRYLIRSIENNRTKPKREMEPIDSCIVVGLTTEKNELKSRIEKRAHDILSSGAIDEARELAAKYGWDNEAMSGIVYKLIREYIDKKTEMSDLRTRFAVNDWRLAKRQITWLKRNKYINWVQLFDAEAYISTRIEQNE